MGGDSVGWNGTIFSPWKPAVQEPVLVIIQAGTPASQEQNAQKQKNWNRIDSGVLNQIPGKGSRRNCKTQRKFYQTQIFFFSILFDVLHEKFGLAVDLLINPGRKVNLEFFLVRVSFLETIQPGAMSQKNNGVTLLCQYGILRIARIEPHSETDFRDTIFFQAVYIHRIGLTAEETIECGLIVLYNL